jgi:BirA family transcriptional regulator, biotin operon repressor / biotin---[acetyl-CoA-carboxylase] ligase
MRTGYKIIHLESVDSTSNYAATLISEGKAAHGTVILADDQFAGKGQRGAEWHVKPGENLTFSLILFPDNLSVSEQFVLSQITALAIQDLLRKFGISSQIKWPNDILVDEQKIAGVLIENQLRGSMIASSIIGVGINVNQTGFGQLNATSIKKEKDQFFIINDLLFSFLNSFENYWSLWLEQGKPTLESLYREKLLGVDSERSFEDAKGVFRGIVSGVTEEGKLKIRRGDKECVYDLKEVRFIFRNEL